MEKEMLQLSRYGKRATVRRTVPKTKDYSAQNINNAEAVKPWSKETRIQKQSTNLVVQLDHY